MRITDLPEDEQESYNGNNRGSSSIIDSIKRKSEVQSDQEPIEDPTQGVSVGKIKGKVESTKLREILNSMGSDDAEY